MDKQKKPKGPSPVSIMSERMTPEQRAEWRGPLLTEVLTLSDAALIAFVDFIRLNSVEFTRDPAMVRRVFTAYVVSDGGADR